MKNLNLIFALSAIVFSSVLSGCSSMMCCSNPTPQITKKEVLKAQDEWAAGIVAIGKTYKDGGDYKKAAEDMIDNLYAYDTGKVVLFKPTKASEKEFRTSKNGALSYFVGNNPDYKEDKGFAIQPWKNVEFRNEEIYINDDLAVAMGNYYFTTYKGKRVKVEYTFLYKKMPNGQIKIIVHHSSLPYKKG